MLDREIVARNRLEFSHLFGRFIVEHLPYYRPCNASSVSASTGIPRETVRRKVRWLIEHGFVEQVARDKLCLTRRAAARFTAFDLETVERFRLLIGEVDAVARRRREHEARAAEPSAAAPVTGAAAPRRNKATAG